jgi:hypothetical protein
MPIRTGASYPAVGERSGEYVDADVKPLLCSDVEFLADMGCIEQLELVG